MTTKSNKDLLFNIERTLNALNFNNPISFADKSFNDNNKKIFLSNDEIQYIVVVFSNLEAISQQRSFIDLVHFRCDDSTISRFMNSLSQNTPLDYIMINC